MTTDTLDSASSVATDDTAMIQMARHLVGSNECEIPVLPEVSLELLNLTADVDCNPADIVALFKRDQSLTAHLLKIANSARYSSGQTVTSIQQAVARLGLLRVREIVFVISCQSRVFNCPEFDEDVRASFRLSLATAAFSQEIARSRRMNVEDAFLCGLLHDVGRPILLQSLLDRRNHDAVSGTDDELREAAAQQRIPMASRLVLSWELPERLATTIENQQTPMEAEAQEKQAAILNLAIDLATMVLHDETSLPSDYNHPMMSALNLYADEFKAIWNQRDAVRDWVGATL
ncbi:MAG: HDOD domain-containing protein [Planctomycetaceae bacterium]|nr:HDOD domain-containing protein [Planctomycetaceae bacterium]